MLSGVYEIYCVVTGKRYIGSSVDIAVRWGAHRYALRRKRHPNGHLQAAWNKYGEHAFVFAVLAYMQKDKLLDIESRYISVFCACDRRYGYNLNPTAQSRLGVPHKLSTRAKISAANKGNKSRTGKPHTRETRAKMSASQKGRTVPLERRRKISMSLTGKPLSAVTRAKISAANRNKPKPLGFGYKVGAAQAKFNQEDICELRRLTSIGMSRRAIAKIYGTTHNVVSKALDGRSAYYAALGGIG